MRKLLSLFILIMILSCSKNGKEDDGYIAKVNNSVLTLEDAESIRPAFPNQKYTINNIAADWVDQELLYLAAKEGGLDNVATLNSQVEIYRKELLGNIALENFLKTQIKIENAEIKSYYDKNRDLFRRLRNGAKIMHYFFTDDTAARFIADAIRQENDIIDRKELLATYNVEVSSVEEGYLVAELDREIFSNNQTNTVIGPIKTEYGYHVIEVLGRFSAGTQIDVDEVYDEIYQRLLNQKKALMSNKYLDSLRNKYSVKINLEQNQ